ncbi:hypothetical protein LINPERHAP2_LOCUS19141 [Linum perenne]
MDSRSWQIRGPPVRRCGLGNF